MFIHLGQFFDKLMAPSEAVLDASARQTLAKQQQLFAEVIAFKRAAAELGMSLSSWVRLVCRKECGLNSPKK